MMRFAVMSGADINAGDFLIVNRAKQLLKHFYPDCELIEFKRNHDIRKHLPIINGCDYMVFAGGPGYVADMYPGRFPLVDDLDDLKIPIFLLGMGGYMRVPGETVRFDNSSRSFLDRVAMSGADFGCRDYISREILLENGYSNAIFTGCPAWYDLGYVGQKSLRATPSLHEIKKIALSDPADPQNAAVAIHLVDLVQKELSPDEILFLFHRGWASSSKEGTISSRKSLWLKEVLEKKGVTCVDISGSVDGFGIYDSCDIHVGFRVHAHLYNLSHRIPSFLIEEDGRGFGANDALGYTSHFLVPNKTVIERYGSALLKRLNLNWEIKNSKGIQIAGKMIDFVRSESMAGYPQEQVACQTMSNQFESMSNHIKSMTSRA